MSTKRFIQIVALAAVAVAWGMWFIVPADPDFSIGTVGTLALLALTAELMGFLLPRGARGSVAFIPNLTTLMLVPNFGALIAVGGAKVVSEVINRRAPHKLIFNTAQLVLSYGIGVLTFRALGGQSLFAFKYVPVATATVAVGMPLTIAYAVVFSINSILVSRIIGLATKTPTIQVWRENSLSTVGLDVLALPLVFVFGWIYANYGPMFACLIWLPILGLRQMNTTNLELAQTNRELLELMIKSIEARDPYTSGHSRRVKDYAIQIARLAGLSAGEVEKIGTAALLHDVGKIYDKYAPILAKEDRLTPEEWAIIKEHPVDGANLVATMTTLRHLIPAVRHHHENWDGTGYPDGLKGTDIPLASRIIMFADTLDAMTTKRPYRGPLGEEAVRAELIRCRGKQFDPEITERLLKNDFWSSLFPPVNRTLEKAGILRLMASGARD